MHFCTTLNMTEDTLPGITVQSFNSVTVPKTGFSEQLVFLVQNVNVNEERKEDVWQNPTV